MVSPTPAVALLRGVNVGGRGRLPMAELRRLVADAGCEQVSTYIQSGNVVFTTTVPADDLEVDLARRIEASTGLDVAVVVRSAAELAGVVAGNPFLDEGLAPKQLHVTFLQAAPAAGALRDLDVEGYLPERVELRGRELFLALPDGIGRSKLAAALSERRLGVPGTTRNWNTVTTLLDLVDALR